MLKILELRDSNSSLLSWFLKELAQNVKNLFLLLHRVSNTPNKIAKI